ncbi:helix-turn-helix domain-containing protein [Zavarzinia sp.]|uniref:helix-turn-helix domain-containing protein n=1 Tax=Zavarzinia sp. TaxID=2027920 RepID=UPI003BB8164E
MAKENPQRRWPTAEIINRIVFSRDAGPIRFVDTEAAARYLSLEAHTLECYRSLGDGPAFYKFGRYVRYAVSDLDAWAEHCRKEPARAANGG